MKLKVRFEYEYEVEISEDEKKNVIEKLDDGYIKDLKNELDDMFLSDDGRYEDSKLNFKYKVEEQRKIMVRILENKVELVKENLSYDEVLSKIEQATRLCYRSKRSETREGREKFLKNLIGVGHESIIEHGSLSFLITTDRACANQIVRHRMASYSQESTRYVNLSDFDIVLDKSYTYAEQLAIKITCKGILETYEDLGGDKKSTRDKARAILPQCTATKLYMTMNFRELRHFLKLRLDKAAHQFIREIAYQILKIMKEEYPVFVFDFDLADYEDIYNLEKQEDMLAEND